MFLERKMIRNRLWQGVKLRFACQKVLMHKRPGLSLFDPVVPIGLTDQVLDGIDLIKCTIFLLTGEEQQRYHQA